MALNTARPSTDPRMAWVRDWPRTKRTSKDCGWKHPKAPAVRKLWKEGATEAVLEFLRDTPAGC